MKDRDGDGDGVNDTAEIITALVPAVLAVCATAIACFALASNSTDSVKIAFAGAAGAALGGAAGLARSPSRSNSKDKTGVQEIRNAENVDISVDKG